MGKIKHSTVSKRRMITITELAEYYGVHRNTMRKYVEDFGKLDVHDIYSIMDFVYYLVKKRVAAHAKPTPPPTV